MSRPSLPSDCAAVRARALAGEPLLAQQAAHALHCAACEAELEWLRTLESAGRALAVVRAPTPEQIRVVSGSSAIAPATGTRFVRHAIAAGAVAVVIALLVVVWPRASTDPASPEPVSMEEPVAALVGEVRAIRGSAPDAHASPVLMEWALPAASGLESWTLESTPVEALIPSSYAWLAEVLSELTL